MWLNNELNNEENAPQITKLNIFTLVADSNMDQKMYIEVMIHIKKIDYKWNPHIEYEQKKMKIFVEYRLFICINGRKTGA